MLGAIAVEHQIARAQDGAIAFVQLTFKDQKLFVPIVAVPHRRHARRHTVDVKASAKFDSIVQLQDTVTQCSAIWIYKCFECGRVDIGDLAVGGGNGFHVGFPWDF